MRYSFICSFDAKDQAEADGHYINLYPALIDAREHMQEPPVRDFKISELKSPELQALATCHDCGALPGETHKSGCDVERCSVCGHQKLGCDCEGHDPLFARWTGFWPGEAEAKALGVDLNAFYADGYFKAFFIKPKEVT